MNEKDRFILIELKKYIKESLNTFYSKVFLRRDIYINTLPANISDFLYNHLFTLPYAHHD